MTRIEGRLCVGGSLAGAGILTGQGGFVALAAMTLSVLTPIYDERSTVDDILDHVLSVRLPVGLDIEIVVPSSLFRDLHRGITQGPSPVEHWLRLPASRKRNSASPLLFPCWLG